MLPLRSELCAILLLTYVTTLNGAFWMGGTSPTSETHKCSSDFVVNQKKIYALFRHIFSPTWNPVLTRVAKEFNVTDMTRWRDEKFPKELMDYGKSMMKGRIKPTPKTYPFVYHLEPSVREFHTVLAFYKHMKDFNGVLDGAAWLRNISNEESFMYGFFAYLIHHTEEEFLLPPPYEINPYKFFRDDVIRTAHLAKMSSCGDNFADENGIKVKYIDYDGPVNVGWEGELAYFREDIDLNAYYYLFKLSFESSLGQEYFANTSRGEIFIYEHQQLLARYNLERFGLEFDAVEPISLFEETFTGYYPLMSHANGFPVIPRPFRYKEDFEGDLKSDALREERGILTLIDLGGLPHPGGKLDFKRPGGTNFLGNLIEGNVENKSNFPKFWPTLLKLVSGPKRYRTRKDQMDFSNVFDHHETQLRDPAYFEAMQKMAKLVKRHQDHLPPYDFEAKFIDVVDVKVSELQTMFEKRSVDITNAVAMEPVHGDAEEWLRDEDVRFKVNIKVLTHIPFYYDLKVHADNPTDAVVRVFLGPVDEEADRIDLYNWNEMREYFFQIDYYPVKLHRGDNKIVRKSSAFTGFGSGFKSFEDLAAKGDEESFHISSRDSFCAFPERLILPKATPEGEDYVFYFVVTPTDVDINDLNTTRLCSVGSRSHLADSWPMGFPFNRKINNEDFLVKNSAATKVTIYHKEKK